MNDKKKNSREKEDRITQKRHREQYIVCQMIQIYCKRNHKELYKKHGGMCPECLELADYAVMRSEHCPFMAKKTFCSNCTVHCYKADMREKIRSVMRFSGPRILFYHPFMACWHVITSRREKMKQLRESKDQKKGAA